MTSSARAVSGLGLVVLAAGCMRGTPPPPDTLSDGSPARPPPVALEGIDGPSVLTRLRVLRRPSGDAGSRAVDCPGWPGDAGARLVERVGTSGASVTLLARSGRKAYACDRIPGQGSGRTAWCGRSFDHLPAGRLRDPRLSLTCRGASDRLLGFAWIQPAAATSYVAVSRGTHSEVYRVIPGMPVRIVTDDVDLADASARFSISEHAQDGRRLRQYVLEPRVSG